MTQLSILTKADQISKRGSVDTTVTQSEESKHVKPFRYHLQKMVNTFFLNVLIMYVQLNQ